MTELFIKIEILLAFLMKISYNKGIGKHQGVTK